MSIEYSYYVIQRGDTQWKCAGANLEYVVETGDVFVVQRNSDDTAKTFTYGVDPFPTSDDWVVGTYSSTTYKINGDKFSDLLPIPPINYNQKPVIAGSGISGTRINRTVEATFSGGKPPLTITYEWLDYNDFNVLPSPSAEYLDVTPEMDGLTIALRAKAVDSSGKYKYAWSNNILASAAVEPLEVVSVPVLVAEESCTSTYGIAVGQPWRISHKGVVKGGATPFESTYFIKTTTGNREELVTFDYFGNNCFAVPDAVGQQFKVIEVVTDALGSSIELESAWYGTIVGSPKFDLLVEPKWIIPDVIARGEELGVEHGQYDCEATPLKLLSDIRRNGYLVVTEENPVYTITSNDIDDGATFTFREEALDGACRFMYSDGPEFVIEPSAIKGSWTSNISLRYEEHQLRLSRAVFEEKGVYSDHNYYIIDLEWFLEDGTTVQLSLSDGKTSIDRVTYYEPPFEARVIKVKVTQKVFVEGKTNVPTQDKELVEFITIGPYDPLFKATYNYTYLNNRWRIATPAASLFNYRIEELQKDYLIGSKVEKYDNKLYDPYSITELNFTVDPSSPEVISLAPGIWAKPHNLVVPTLTEPKPAPLDCWMTIRTTAVTTDRYPDDWGLKVASDGGDDYAYIFDPDTLVYFGFSSSGALLEQNKTYKIYWSPNVGKPCQFFQSGEPKITDFTIESDTNTEKCVSYYSMFALDWNHSIAYLSFQNITTFSKMFLNNKEFNQPIPTIGSKARYLDSMFEGATNFNQDISGWDTSKVGNMDSMFKGLRLNGVNYSSFNQDISGWNTTTVAFMDSMFENAQVFNQDLSKWCVYGFKYPGGAAKPPVDFDEFAFSWTEPRPQWGQPCP